MRFSKALVGAAAILAGVVCLLLVLGPGAFAQAQSEDRVTCAKEEAQRNFSSFSDFQCDLTSYRKAWHLDGKLDKDNVLKKQVYVKRPDMRKEVFLSGTLNGKPAEKKAFIWEKLGLAAGLDMIDIECFRKNAAADFTIVDKGIVEQGGQSVRVLRFSSLAPKRTQLLAGHLELPADSCQVTAMTGRVIHKMIQRNEVDFSASFAEVAPGTWLMTEVTIKGQVKLGPLKRRIDARNVFSNYRINTGLTDAFFD